MNSIHLIEIIKPGKQNEIDISRALTNIKLSQCGERKISELHHALLFALAYPDNDKVYDIVRTYYLKHFKPYCYKCFRNNYNLHLPGADIIAEFSNDFIRSFDHTFPVFYESSNANKYIQSTLLRTSLFGCEKERFESESYTLDDWFKIHTIKKQERISYLLSHFEESYAKPEVRDFIFEQLKVQVRLKKSDGLFFNADLSPRSIYTKDDIQKDSGSKLKLKNNSVDSNRTRDIILNSKLVLASYFRETDPITLALSVKHITTPSGFDIMLFSMEPKRRLALESYIGYMVYRNGVACAYGGGWLFLKQCKIGINVFPYLRGGASSVLFKELLLTYKQLFRIETFTVEPYQFGRNNPDGIKSGAFWFYYKHGFRPVDDSLNEIAQVEWEKIKSDKNYRTSRSVLLKLAQGDMVLFPSNKAHSKFIHPYQLNATITELYEKYISSDIGVDAARIFRSFEENLNVFEKEILYEQYFPLFFFLALDNPNERTINHLKKWMYAKVMGNEFDAALYQQNLYGVFKKLSRIGV